MKKTIGLISMLLIILVTLTGCVNVDYEVEVKQNGSGEISYIYGFSKETLEKLQVSAEDMVESMKEQAEENSYTVEAYENDEISGFKASKHIEDLTKDFSLQEAFGEEYIKDTENNGIKIEKSLFTVKYSQNADIDLTSMAELGESVKMTYKVKLPTKAKTNNATESKGKELTWNLTAGEVNKIEFTATGVNLVSLIIVILSIVLVVGGALAVVFTLNKKKGTKKEN